nr:alpha-amylase [Anaerolineae bacterium]
MSTAFTTPEWVKDAVFYQIFPDRFAKSKRVPKPSNLEPWDSPPTLYGFKGGDLLGVVEHLDYLENLGITAIYFNPIFQSAANHRYHTHDYYRVDPLLGGDAAFRELLDEAHRRDIRIVLDGVFNHASRGFFQFHHILENGAASPYLDWFVVKGFPLNAYQGTPNYQCWYDLPALPEFNTDNPEVRAFILDVARYWIEQGIDGWRLDVPHEIDDDGFWREFRRVVKAANPEAYIVGEIWDDARHWLRGDQFDAVMNYIFNRACLGFFGGEHLDTSQRPGGYQLRSLSAVEFANVVDSLLSLYGWGVTLVQLNLLSSHDEPRFLTLTRGDEAALRLATLFQMTYPGAPCIYYGDEIGMEGGPDPDCRRAFPWDESRWNIKLRDFVKQCIALRKAYPALRRGDYISLYAEGKVYAYLRRLDDDRLVVVLNNDASTYRLDIPVSAHLPDGTRLRDLIGGGEASVVAGRLTGLTLPPRSGAVLAVGAEGYPTGICNLEAAIY